MPAFNQVIEAIERVADRFELDFQKKRKMGRSSVNHAVVG